MEEIRRTKIKEAMKETLNVYEKLDLNMTEIAGNDGTDSEFRPVQPHKPSKAACVYIRERTLRQP